MSRGCKKIDIVDRVLSMDYSPTPKRLVSDANMLNGQINICIVRCGKSNYSSIISDYGRRDDMYKIETEFGRDFIERCRVLQKALDRVMGKMGKTRLVSDIQYVDREWRASDLELSSQLTSKKTSRKKKKEELYRMRFAHS